MTEYHAPEPRFQHPAPATRHPRGSVFLAWAGVLALSILFAIGTGGLGLFVVAIVLAAGAVLLATSAGTHHR